MAWLQRSCGVDPDRSIYPAMSGRQAMERFPHYWPFARESTFHPEEITHEMLIKVITTMDLREGMLYISISLQSRFGIVKKSTGTYAAN